MKFNKWFPFMGQGCIPILIVLSVTTATVMYSNKIHHDDDDIDKIQRALAGIYNVIPVNADLNFRNIGVDPAVYQQIRYILAPAYLSVHAHNYDTVLSVCSIYAVDSALQATAAGQKLLWQSRDDRYYYFLTSSH